MALGLANNVGALNAQHNLTRSSNQLNKSIERLSSGFKINRGADGPAALVISEKQRAQISGLRAAIDNTEKAVAVVQTAEGALSEINSLLVKVRSLAIDSANAGVNDEDALAANQAEITNALETIDRIANNTQFGEKKLLDGSSGVTGTSSVPDDMTFLKSGSETPAGAYAVNVSVVAERAFADALADQTAALTQDENLTINGVRIELKTGDTQANVITKINAASDQTGVTAELDGTTTRVYSNAFGSAVSIDVLSDVASAPGVGLFSSGFGTALIQDTGEDIVGTIGGNAAVGKGNVLVGSAGSSVGVSVQLLASAADATLTETGTVGEVAISNNSLVFQVGANQGQTVSIGVNSVASKGLGIGVEGNSFTNLSEINVQSAQGAQDALGVLDASIDEISNLRGTLGAFQANTLESTANNMRTTLENTINAESVIRDTDFAEEISNFTNSQVLVQAGTSVLSSANQSSQLILSLLG